MKRLMLGFWGLAILVLMLQAGCSRDPASPASEDLQADEEAVVDLLYDEAGMFDDGSRGEGEQLGPNQAPPSAPTQPLFWWREITGIIRHVDATVEYPEEGYPYADVTITLDLTGTYNILTMEETYGKDLHDVGVRYAYLERQGERWERFRGWRLLSLSGMEIVSQPSTRMVNSVHVSSSMGSVDTTLTDVSTLVPVEDLFSFEPGEEVTVTVDTGDGTDLVFLHTRFWRRPFTHIGGGVFEGTWTVAEDPVHPEWRRRAAVDVITAETLFDSEAPYDSHAWVVPYRVDAEGVHTP
jgi:hypothetical protein